MEFLVIAGPSAALGFLFGKYGTSWLGSVYQAYKHRRNVADAKALLAKVEADALALAKAKTIVAAEPVAPAPVDKSASVAPQA